MLTHRWLGCQFVPGALLGSLCKEVRGLHGQTVNGIKTLPCVFPKCLEKPAFASTCTPSRQSPSFQCFPTCSRARKPANSSSLRPFLIPPLKKPNPGEAPPQPALQRTWRRGRESQAAAQPVSGTRGAPRRRGRGLRAPSRASLHRTQRRNQSPPSRTALTPGTRREGRRELKPRQSAPPGGARGVPSPTLPGVSGKCSLWSQRGGAGRREAKGQNLELLGVVVLFRLWSDWWESFATGSCSSL